MTDSRVPYVIQYTKLLYEDFVDAPFKMAIIEPDNVTLTPQQLSFLHREQHKYIVAYLSIGEAETHREYWQHGGWNVENGQLPGWVVNQNAEWGGYRVKFWEPDWQDLTIARAEKLVAKGYHGIFLDVVDVYQALQEVFPDRDLETEMKAFVAKISTAVKAMNPDVLVIPNNGLTLLTDPSYLEHIDGVAKESTFYYMSRDPETGQLHHGVPDWKDGDLSYLTPLVDDATGKFVLAIEYPPDHETQWSVLEEAQSHRFVPYIATYHLDEIPQVNAEYFAAHPFNASRAHFLEEGVQAWLFVVGIACLCLLLFLWALARGKLAWGLKG